MLQCWSDEPKERPTFSKLRSKFDSLISAQNSDAASYIDLMNIDLEQAYYNILPTDDDDEFFVLMDPYDHLKTGEDEEKSFDDMAEEDNEKKPLHDMEDRDKKPYDHLRAEEDGQKQAYDHLTAESIEMEEGATNPAYSTDSPTSLVNESKLI